MGAPLVCTEFLLLGVCGRSRRVEVLDYARGAAENDGSAFVTVDFAEAVLSDWVATDQAFLADGAVALRCT